MAAPNIVNVSTITAKTALDADIASSLYVWCYINLSMIEVRLFSPGNHFTGLFSSWEAGALLHRLMQEALTNLSCDLSSEEVQCA